MTLCLVNSEHSHGAKLLRIGVLSLCTSLLSSGVAWAQDYPNRPIRIVSITGAGTGIDDFSRLMAKVMSEKLGQGVIIDNKPGANGIVATDVVAKSKPDGYTFLYTSSSAITSKPTGMRQAANHANEWCATKRSNQAMEA